MEKGIVEIYNDEARCGTWTLSEGFKRKHSEILKFCRKYDLGFAELENNKSVSNTFIIRKLPRDTSGKPVTEYLLNEAQTIFLGSMLRAKSGDDPVFRFKINLAKDFVKLKRIISALANQKQSPEWIIDRALGKIERKSETDTIKDFTDYCRAQGSKSPEKYYMAFTKAANDGLFNFNGVFKNKRDVMTASQLREVQFADKIVSKGIIEGMALSMPYKEIFIMVRDRLIELGKMYGKGEVVSKQLTLDIE